MLAQHLLEHEIRLNLFGDFSVTGPLGEILSPRSRKARFLLAILCLKGGRSMERRSLAAQLWPDSPDNSSLFNLRQLLSNLKGECPRISEAIKREGNQFVSLDLSRFLVDVHTFEMAESDAFDQALELYRGPLLAFWDEPWLTADRLRLEKRALHMLRDLAGRESGSRRVLYLKRATEIEPYDEGLQKELYLALAATQDLSGLRTSFEQFRKKLNSEFRLDPHKDTKSLVRSLLLGSANSRFDPTTSRPENRLPSVSGSLIGRQTELEILSRDLSSSRLVTITGPGGSGKTRLAIEFGHLYEKEFLGETTFVDLSALRDGSMVAQAMGQCLRIGRPEGESWEDALISHLRGLDRLLIVDNCEHLLRFCSDLFRRIQLEAHGIKVLATSRSPIHLDWERTVPLSSLSFPDEGPGSIDANSFPALQLFTDRALAVSHTFKLSSSNLGSVVAICRAVDGLPLGIKMAAARSAVIGLEDIACRLQENLSVLRSAEVDIPEEKRSMESVIGWSFELLNPSEKTVLRRLTVFTGGSTVNAAEQVCGFGEVDASKIIEIVSRLMDASLLRQKENRFYLYESVRQFLLGGQSDDWEVLEVEHRFVEHMFSVCVEAVSGIAKKGPSRATEEFGPELDNVRKALRVCTARGLAEKGLKLASKAAPVFSAMGRDDEAVFWLNKWLESGLKIPDLGIRMEGMFVAGLYYRSYFAGVDPSTARRDSTRVSEELVSLARELADINFEIKGLINLARANLWWDGEKADQYLKLALDLSNKATEEVGIHVALRVLSQRAYDRGSIEEAQTLVKEAERLSGEAEDVDERSNCLVAKSFYLREKCNYDSAERVLGQIDRILRERPDARGEAYNHLRYAELYLDSYRFEAMSGHLGYVSEFFGRSYNRLHGVLSDGLERYFAASVKDAGAVCEGITESLEGIFSIADSHPSSYWHGACLLLESMALLLARSEMNMDAAIIFGAAQAVRKRDWASVSPSVENRWRHLGREVDLEANRSSFEAGFGLSPDEICDKIASIERLYGH